MDELKRGDGKRFRSPGEQSQDSMLIRQSLPAVIWLITCYALRMIRSFKSRTLKRFFIREEAGRIQSTHRDTVRDILARLNTAITPEDMDLPGFRLHRLKGNHAGFWAVTVRANWRVIFRFEDGEPVDVDYLDYH